MEEKINYPKKAMELFHSGYNCSQSVFLAFIDKTGMEFDFAAKLSSSFGGGMGRLRQVSGAVTSMFMIAGILFGYNDNNDYEAKVNHYKLIQHLAKMFEERTGSIICKDLLGLGEGPYSPVPDKRTKEYYDNRPCEKLVGIAAEIIAEELINKKMEAEKMKVAIACNGNTVTQHFGHCENFHIYDVENGAILKSEVIDNPGHRPGFLPNYLNDYGVNVIIAGGMGGGAVEIFNEKGIQVIVGANGSADSLIDSFNKGELKSTDSYCNH